MVMVSDDGQGLVVMGLAPEKAQSLHCKYNNKISWKYPLRTINV